VPVPWDPSVHARFARHIDQIWEKLYRAISLSLNRSKLLQRIESGRGLDSQTKCAKAARQPWKRAGRYHSGTARLELAA
jgi:hypothetical protein